MTTMRAPIAGVQGQSPALDLGASYGFELHGAPVNMSLLAEKVSGER